MKILDIKELRIGNIVCDDSTFKTFNFIESVFCKNGEYAIGLKNKNYATWLEHNGEQMIFGIPLTEEWLIKLGFEKADKGIEIHLKNGLFNWYSSNPKSIILEFDNGINGYDFEIECEFFHQLQNIIFDLMGEELEVKF